MPVLHVLINDFCQIYPLEEGKPVIIGRAPECDIVLSSPAVSRRHAVIVYKNGICGVKDLQSFNGTLLNDEPVSRPRPLTAKDVLRISSFSIRIVYEKDTSGSMATLPAVDTSYAPTAETAVPTRDDDTQAGMPMGGTRIAGESAEVAMDATLSGIPDSEFTERSGVDTSLFEPVLEIDRMERIMGPLPLITPEEAEKVIPLNEPDTMEKLVLSGEDEEEGVVVDDVG